MLRSASSNDTGFFIVFSLAKNIPNPLPKSNLDTYGRLHLAAALAQVKVIGTADTNFFRGIIGILFQETLEAIFGHKNLSLGLRLSPAQFLTAGTPRTHLRSMYFLISELFALPCSVEFLIPVN